MDNSAKFWALILVGALLVAPGCGDDDEPAEPERFPELSAAEDLQYASEHLGVGFQHGATISLNPTDQGTGVLQRVEGVIDHAFLHVNLYDIFAPVLGEYLYYTAGASVEARGASHFHSNPGDARFVERAADLDAEVKAAVERAGTQFSSFSVVLDLWKPDGSWYLPWDGKMARPPESYGFFQTENRQDLLAQIEAVASEQKPRYFIVGSDMERLLVPGEESYSPAEFSNFLSFFQQAVDVIHSASPDTKVGAGINWERFAQEVAGQYLSEADAELESNLEHAALDAGFQSALLPLLQAGDILALKSYILPNDGELQDYQFLRRLPELYQVEKPLVWYSVGSPVTSTSSYNQQRFYLERFAEWNAGLDPEVIAWRALMNIDQTDVASGDVGGRCLGLTGPSNDFKVPRARCYDGLFSSTLQPKAVFSWLQSELN